MKLCKIWNIQKAVKEINGTDNAIILFNREESCKYVEILSLARASEINKTEVSGSSQMISE